MSRRPATFTKADLARAMAENGATEAELNAVFGWADGSGESSTYIRKASRKRLAKSGIVKVLSQPDSQTTPSNLKNKG